MHLRAGLDVSEGALVGRRWGREVLQEAGEGVAGVRVQPAAAGREERGQRAVDEEGRRGGARGLQVAAGDEGGEAEAQLAVAQATADGGPIYAVFKPFASVADACAEIAASRCSTTKGRSASSPILWR